MNRSARCLCGSVAFTVSSRARTAHECHCSQCRRWSGHVWSYVTVRWQDVVFDADGSLVWFALTDRARRGFCGECGSSLFWSQNGSAKVDVSAGAFDEPSGLVTRAPFLPRFKGDYYEI